jgi:hypothetical protein
MLLLPPQAGLQVQQLPRLLPLVLLLLLHLPRRLRLLLLPLLLFLLC